MTDNKNTVLEINDLKKYFPIKGGLFKTVKGYVKAVDGVSLNINGREVLGLVGESGCGKTTLSRCIVGLHNSDGGSIIFRSSDGKKYNLSSMTDKEINKIRPKIQYVFQDPFSSLNPRMTVLDILTEPLKINRVGTTKERKRKAEEMMSLVSLNLNMLNRFPHEFSGGQRQRIVVARSLMLNPELLICDEPVSALDVSVQAQIINILKDLQEEMGLTYLFVAHDLSVVNYISDRIAVMYLGKIVEISTSDSIYSNPKHPYTEALLGSIPVPDPEKKRKKVQLEGTVPNPANPPSGCSFHPRCKYAIERCKEETPELEEVNGHKVACFRAKELKLKGFA